MAHKADIHWDMKANTEVNALNGHTHQLRLTMYSTRLNNQQQIISHLVHPQVPLSLLQLLDPPDKLLDSPPHLLPLLDHTQNTLNVMHMANTSIHNAYRNESERTVKFHSYNM